MHLKCIPEVFKSILDVFKSILDVSIEYLVIRKSDVNRKNRTNTQIGYNI